jgi:hypothetical protein
MPLPGLPSMSSPTGGKSDISQVMVSAARAGAFASISAAMSALEVSNNHTAGVLAWGGVR